MLVVREVASLLQLSVDALLLLSAFGEFLAKG